MSDNLFSSIDFVGQCLVDEERTRLFKKAINKIVKKTDVVFDVGTGSGIMAILAAQAGAKKVVAVEFDKFIAQIARNAIALNKFADVISLVTEDAKKCVFPVKTKFDVVIAEMLTTGMVEEYQVQAINNIHNQGVVGQATTFLPYKQDTHITLTNTDFTVYGLKFPMVSHLWKWHDWSNLKVKKITEPTLLNSVMFNNKIEEVFTGLISFKVKKGGIVNSVYLTSETFLADGISVKDTEALNAPMLIPIKEFTVEVGDVVNIKVGYIFGGGYNHFKVDRVE
ncbi:MAG: hypothetical protein A3J93_01625 [Candidatus Magasanikbacteria bacterium RIFOXYC2_FULL_42_28]|uniref:PRMT5 oligomerisation domain-containing protein n=1 Tax=Candidatus Magasanikbacteria bacterium RIFOXYC2_FULL_42_28 TaxID=1798704 RepID=A0A1F6NY03_9BACT|nr:MAG: hypothetical protein A3J93_01625 [Candidatus Magasanikbacteria bacterium RIFOXYC2_FULL_42_28]